jgi:hypothetical protein
MGGTLPQQKVAPLVDGAAQVLYSDGSLSQKRRVCQC